MHLKFHIGTQQYPYLKGINFPKTPWFPETPSLKEYLGWSYRLITRNQGSTCANRELLSSDSPVGFGKRSRMNRWWYMWPLAYHRFGILFVEHFQCFHCMSMIWSHFHTCAAYVLYIQSASSQCSLIHISSLHFWKFIHSQWQMLGISTHIHKWAFVKHHFWHPCWISSAHIIDESRTFYILFGTRRKMYDKKWEGFLPETYHFPIKVQNPTSHRKVYISDDFFPTGSWVRAVRWVYFFAGWRVVSINNLMGPYHRTPKQVAIELLDTQV